MKYANLLVVAAMALGCLTEAPRAFAQTPPIVMEAVTAEWLVGEWRTAQSDTIARDDDGSVWMADDYWLRLSVKRLPDGRLEALTVAQQMKDSTEHVTWRNDIEIRNGEVLIRPRETVGKVEWRSFSPKTFRLQRSGALLVGRMSANVFLPDHAKMVQFSR